MPGSEFANPRYMLTGDPGFFSLLPLAGKLIAKGVGKLTAAKAAAGPGTAIAKIGRLALPTIGTVATVGQVGSAVRRGISARRAVAVGAGAVAVAAGAAKLLPGERRRFRRMNPLNPKALKRATRRLSGFSGFVTSTQRELSKLAPQKRCPPKRKAPCR